MLDWDSLYGEAGERAMTGGKKRFYDNRVKNLQTREENGKRIVFATVRGDRDYSASVQFDEQGGLYDYACDCAFDTATQGPCRHIVAVALAYENKFPAALARGEHASVYRSDAGVRTLIERFGKERRRRGTEGSRAVHLTPHLRITDDGRLCVKFTVGVKKMYTVKDIGDFAACWTQKKEKRYGVELTLLHVPSSFDALSAQLAAFIVGCKREKEEFLRDAGAVDREYRDELRLTAGSVDAFMRLYAGQTVACGDSSQLQGVRRIAERENAVPLALTLGRVSGGYILQSALGANRVVHGKDYTYIITQNCIYPVTSAYYDAVFGLIAAVEARGRLFIAESDMSQFYNSVLTRVLEFCDIDAGDIKLSVFEAAPLELKVYFFREGESVHAEVHASYDGETDIDIFDENAACPFVRDFDAESAFTDLLAKYFPDYPQLVLYNEQDIYMLLREGLRELMQHAEVYLSDDLKKMKVKKPPRVKVGVRLKSDLLEIDLSAEEYTQAQLHEILDAYRNKRNYVRLTDGTFVDLLDPSVAAISAVTETAHWKGDTLTMPLYYAPYVDAELRNGFFHLERSDGFKKLVQSLDSGENLAQVPPSLKPVMRNYQKTGYRWLKALSDIGFGGILADDMGLGKSLQVIALLLGDRKSSEPSIIVCPTTLVLNWVNELRKFAPELKALAVSGSGETRKELTETFADYDVIITSYELLRRDAPLYASLRFAYAVIDEAQYIKNPQTKNARAVKTLNARHRFALTGTPIENSLSELWSIFDFLMPGYLFSYQKFRDTLETAIVRGDEEAADRLGCMVKPFILRRLKANVLKELPPKIESNVLCPLEGEQRALYNANLLSVRENLRAAGDRVNKVAALGMLTKLRQICCEPSLTVADYTGNSAKCDACMELVRNAVEAGHKVLLFSQFTSMLAVLRARLVQEGISHYLLQGDTPKVERVKLVSRFNGDDTQVFLISLKAGGTGLNLTGADVVIHYDPWWNESVMNQATDRAYRIGQDKSVQVYKLIMQDSVEERIMALQERKTALSGLVMNAASNTGLKTEDLLNLLQ